MENQHLRENVVLISIKVLLGLCVLGYMSSLLGSSEEKQLITETDIETNSSIVKVNDDILPAVPVKKIALQPHCEPINMEISLHLVIVESFSCRPEDVEKEKSKTFSSIVRAAKKRNRNKKSKSETTESMVVYIAVGLLLVSLGAALLEVFKFVNQPTVKTKPALNRSCSLADLTVMRHNRKELMRRDSMVEGGPGHWESRGSSKLLERQSQPQYRRCSFPVGPRDPRRCSNGFGHFEPDFSAPSGQGGYVTSRSLTRKSSSVDVEGSFFPSPHRHAHIRLLHRH